MKFENKTEDAIKVEANNNEVPKTYSTVRTGEFIECTDEVFVNYYTKVGLTPVKEKAVESKIGTKKVETKVLETVKKIKKSKNKK